MRNEKSKLKIVKNTYRTERERKLGRKYILKTEMFGLDVMARINPVSIWGWVKYRYLH